MNAPHCPYCDIAMEERSVPAFRDQFRIHNCPRCSSELKQPLLVAPAPGPAPASATQGGHEDCPECAFGDVHCTNCDDALCPKHVRTIEKYAAYLSEDLARDLRAQFSGRLFCPLCFQSTIKRFSSAPPSPPPKPKIFNWPLILGLLSVFLIIIIGLKRCDTAQTLQSVSYHESSATAGS